MSLRGGTSTKRTRFSALVSAVVVSLLAVACGLPGADEELEGSDAALAAGCANPTCESRDASGQFCLPACSPKCVARHEQSAFWVSPYEVSGTYDLGRHQGVAIVTVSTGFDPRFRLKDLSSKERERFAWTKPKSVGNLPSDMAVAMLERMSGHDHDKVARCSAPEVAFDRKLGNHGRSLSRRPEDAASRRRLASVAEDVQPKLTAQKREASSIASCLRKIENGFCDSVCGNCSYVLPSAATMTSAAGDWSDSSQLVAGQKSCNAEGYYGGGTQKSVPNTFSEQHDNPFTHCAILGCEAESEAPSLKSLIESAPMTGLYGHNSNTDAEAELVAFERCAKGHDDVGLACASCGTSVRGGGRQEPCLAKTNTANNYWARTASPLPGGFFTDLIPPIRRPGANDVASPMCAWGKFPVDGM